MEVLFPQALKLQPDRIDEHAEGRDPKLEQPGCSKIDRARPAAAARWKEQGDAPVSDFI